MHFISEKNKKTQSFVSSENVIIYLSLMNINMKSRSLGQRLAQSITEPKDETNDEFAHPKTSNHFSAPNNEDTLSL